MAYYDRTQRSRPRPTQVDLTGGDGETKSRGVRGNFFVNTELAEVRRLLFKQDPNQTAVTTFRLLASPDPARQDAFLPAREVDRYGQPFLTGWIQQYMMFKTAGCSFLCYDPRAYPGENWETLRWDNPAFILAISLASAKKNKKMKRVEWSYLMERGEKSGKPLDFPTKAHLAFAAIYGQGSELHEPPLGLAGGKPLVLDLASDAGTQVIKLGLLLKEQYQDTIPDDLPLAKAFEVPDPVRMDRGVFFRAFSKDSHDPRPDERKMPGCPPSWDVPPPGPDEKPPSSIGYHVYATRTFGDRNAIIPEATRATLWETLPPLDDVLLFPTPEEQVALLAKYVRVQEKPMLDLFEYAYADKHRSWLEAIPEEIWKEFKGSMSVAPRGGYTTAAAEDRRPRRSRPSWEGDEDDPAPAPAPAPAPGMAAAPRPAAAPDDDDDDPIVPRPPQAAGPAAPPVDSALPPGAVPDDDDDDDDRAPVAAAPAGGLPFDKPPSRTVSERGRQNLEKLKQAQARPAAAVPPDDEDE